MEVEVDLQGMQLGQERDQVLQRTAQSINRPRHDDVELAPGRALAQGVESGPAISTLGAADALVAIDVEDLAAHSVGDLPERALLVLGRLPIQRTDADVQSGAAHGDSPTDEANASSRRWSRLYENQLVFPASVPQSLCLQLTAKNQGRHRRACLPDRLGLRLTSRCHAAAGDPAAWLCFLSRSASATNRMPKT